MCIHFIYTLTRGQTYTQFAKAMETINIKIFSDTLFYNYQRSLAIPAINSMYEVSLGISRMFINDKGK